MAPRGEKLEGPRTPRAEGCCLPGGGVGEAATPARRYPERPAGTLLCEAHAPHESTETLCVSPAWEPELTIPTIYLVESLCYCAPLPTYEVTSHDPSVRVPSRSVDSDASHARTRCLADDPTSDGSASVRETHGTSGVVGARAGGTLCITTHPKCYLISDLPKLRRCTLAAEHRQKHVIAVDVKVNAYVEGNAETPATGELAGRSYHDEKYPQVLCHASVKPMGLEYEMTIKGTMRIEFDCEYFRAMHRNPSAALDDQILAVGECLGSGDSDAIYAYPLPYGSGISEVAFLARPDAIDCHIEKVCPAHLIVLALHARHHASSR